MRTISLLITSIFLCTDLTAQVKLGLKGDLNLSNFNYQSKNQKNKPRFNTGLLIQIPLSNRFSLQPEFLYSEKGYSVPEDAGITGKAKVNANYLSMPILATYRIHKKIAIGLGVELCYLVNQNLKLNNGPEYDTDYFNDFDYGIKGNLSYEFLKNFGVNVGYYYGVAKPYFNLINDQNGYTIGTERVGSNRAFEFTIFHLINFKSTSQNK